MRFFYKRQTLSKKECLQYNIPPYHLIATLIVNVKYSKRCKHQVEKCSLGVGFWCNTYVHCIWTNVFHTILPHAKHRRNFFVCYTGRKKNNIPVIPCFDPQGWLGVVGYIQCLLASCMYECMYLSWFNPIQVTKDTLHVCVFHTIHILLWAYFVCNIKLVCNSSYEKGNRLKPVHNNEIYTMRANPNNENIFVC